MGQPSADRIDGGNEHPQPVGVYNSPKLLGIDASMTPYNRRRRRFSSAGPPTNYFLGHMRELALMSMAIDSRTTRRPTPASPPTSSAIRSEVIQDMSGAWLYQTYSLFEMRRSFGRS